MRILVLTPTFLPAVGGAELVLLQVCRRLAPRHRVVLLTPYLSPKLLAETASDDYDRLINFEVRRYRDRWSFMRVRGHRWLQGAIPPFSLSAVMAFRRAAKTCTPDVANVHYVMPTGLAAVYGEKVLGLPVVVTYNGRDVPGPGVPPLWKHWHRWVGLSCTDVTFVSEYCRQAVFGDGAARGHVINNGVERARRARPEDVAELKKKLGIEEGERVLFALQRLDPLKRVDVILHSLPTVRAVHPRTRLVIGGKGPDLPRLKDCAESLGVERAVSFAGFVPSEELPAYYALADAFVFHSTYETFGMVLAEAMSYGKPVVSVSSTAIPSVVADEETGLLVPPLDPPSLAQAVNRLLADEALRRRMGERARQRAESLFDWDRIAERYEEVLAAAAAGGRR